ncbi:DUF7115 domain-containing protein [Halorarius halobius]|uniref:DUF7115 domain-containing protein n=1 Tax=Halorarius halobius TaxID=2962671 RepID=UPI0020CE5F1A|nr:hypothetical protein [Halorarius halobius]
MDVPSVVRERLDGESVHTRVPLGGDDAVFVTPTRTLVYRAEGLLSDESVAAYPHGVERLDLSTGRRKATFELTYVDTSGQFKVPADRVDDVLEPVLEGVLAAAGVCEDGERVRELYRFSELTLAITDGRLVKHIGGPVWDPDHETFPFADVTGLDAEEGSVATQLVVELDGRPNRVKVPSEKAELVRRALEEAVLDYHGVDSLAELGEKQGVTDDGEEADTETFEGSGIAPLVGDDADDPDDDAVDRLESTDAQGDQPTTEPSTPDSGADDDDDDEVLARLDALEAAVDRQNDLIQKQQETIETLVEELRRGR